MMPLLVLLLTPAGPDPLGSEVYRPAYLPAEAPFGYLYAPAFDVHVEPRFPATVYIPKAGDVILLSDTNRFWTLLYRLAFTGKPGHGGLVVTMPDGRLGFLEAGFNSTQWTRLTPLDYRLNQYAGYAWVRPRFVPLAADQDRRLTEFAAAAADTPYATKRFMLQVTPFRSRGPLRTLVIGKPHGLREKMMCGEAIVEALVYAGVIDGRTARPAATYPQDLFYDESRNHYLDRHPPLAGGWGAPSLWTPLVGVAAKGSERPRPPSPWPGPAGAYLVYPVAAAGQQVPQPVVVGYVPGEPGPVAIRQEPPQRVGLFDRPPGRLRRR